MKGLAELVVSLCDLCEAEGRLLEAGVLRTVRRVGLLSLGLLFGAAALALFLGALYALLTALFPRPAALGLLGCASAAIAGLFLWSARSGATPADEPEAQGTAQPQPQAGKAAPAGAAAPHTGPVAAEQKDGSAHAPWADVPPYGHSAPSGEPSSPGLGASAEKARAATAHSAADRKNG